MHDIARCFVAGERAAREVVCEAWSELLAGLSSWGRPAVARFLGRLRRSEALAPRGIIDPDELSCRELVELVTEYLEETLAPSVRARFEMHLCTCDRCRVYLRQMRDTVGLARRLSEEALPPEGKEALMRAFRGWKRSTGDVSSS